MSGKGNKGSLKNFLPKVRTSLDSSLFTQKKNPLALFTPVPQDDTYLQYASDRTRDAYDKADAKGKAAILMNVTNKYKPSVDALKSSGLFDLIDQLAKDCNIEDETSQMDLEQGGRRKKKGGVGEPKNVAVGRFGAVMTALDKTAVELHAYIFSFENTTKAIPITAIALANPSTTAIIFNAAKAALGFIGSMCVTNAGITAISLATLACLYDVKFDINSLKFNSNEDKETIEALRAQLQKNLKPSTKQFGSVAQTPQALLDKVAELEAAKQALSDKVANLQKAEAAKATAIAQAKTESEKKALINADKTNEGNLINALNTISKEAAVIAETAAPPAALNANAPPFVSATTTTSSGGRKTKKGGKKKMRNTRRKPLFKY